MISFDVRTLAMNLTIGRKESQSVRETLIVRLIEVAVEIVNYPHRMESILEELLPVYELDYEIPNPSSILARMVAEIKAEKKKCGWDDRLLIKTEFKSILQAYHRAKIVMDLDATILAQSERVTHEKPELTEVVNDNPDADTINELFKTIDRETRPRVPLLSDRYPKFVGGPAARSRSR